MQYNAVSTLDHPRSYQIRFLLDEVSAAAKDYQLNEITFQLGFSAEGQIVFVAKTGLTATSVQSSRTSSPT